MKFWRFRKAEEGHQNDVDAVIRDTPSDYECLWLPVCVTFRQILPRIDSHFCVNERGELALMALPNFTVSKTFTKLMYESPSSGIVLVQRILQDKDESYLAPITLTANQASILADVMRHFTRGEWSQGLKKHDWRKLVSEIRAKNNAVLNDSSYWQEINRMQVIDKTSPKEPDEIQAHPGFVHGIPIFVYTDPGAERVQSKQELQREIFVCQQLARDNIESVRNTIKNSPAWGNLNENDEFVHVINRAEVEIKLYMKAWPSFADIMLNPEMAEFIPGPPTELKFTPKGQEILKRTESRELIFSISNWGDSDIAQVALHMNKFKGQSPKDSVTAPSITIFKDEMGIHALPAKLFRIRAVLFSAGTDAGEPLFLDALPASQIQDVNWKPIAEETASEWWQTDTIAKKVLWLVTYNLASHAIGDPEELIYSVTPIGNDVIQVALLFDNLEEGSPYAFAITRDDFAIKAIPVFPSGTYEMQSDGALVSKTLVRLKNYCITRKGERIDLQGAGQMMQFIKPIYSVVVSGKYKAPEIYETR